MDVRFGAVLALAIVAPVATQWRDPSPHQVRSVTVDGATRLEVLDWGGSGLSVLFVGCYLTAHVHDDIAPKLTDQFHVYAVTRRGIGASDHPSTGYDPQRRADDILDVITALAMPKPILIGNSCGGAILHTLGAQHPDRIGGLLYLDAAEDPTLKLSDYNSPPVDRAHLPQHVERKDPSRALPEAETRQLERWPLDATIRKAMVEDNNVRPDYEHISVPGTRALQNDGVGHRACGLPAEERRRTRRPGPGVCRRRRDALEMGERSAPWGADGEDRGAAGREPLHVPYERSGRDP